MKLLNHFLSFFTFLSLFSGCISKQEETHHYFEMTVVNQQGNVAPEMLELLTLTGIEHDGSLKNIVEQTQKHWLRKPGTERWDIPEINAPYIQRAQQLLQQMKLFQPIDPCKKEYDYLLILGALFESMKDRMEYAIKLWNSGIRFKKIILLSGARPTTNLASENLEKMQAWSKQNLEQMPATEADILQFIYEHSIMPSDMRQLPVQLVNAPRKMKMDRTFANPTAQDTLHCWLNSKPQPGSCLAISHQPYIQFQWSVLKSTLPSNFDLDIAGFVRSNQPSFGIILDNLTRILYQEEQRLNSQ